jgi:hypothetical protein
MRHDSTRRRLGDERLKRAGRSTPQRSTTSPGRQTCAGRFAASAASPDMILPIQAHPQPPRPSQATGRPAEPAEQGWDSAL